MFLVKFERSSQVSKGDSLFGLSNTFDSHDSIYSRKPSLVKRFGFDSVDKIFFTNTEQKAAAIFHSEF